MTITADTQLVDELRAGLADVLADGPARDRVGTAHARQRIRAALRELGWATLGGRDPDGAGLALADLASFMVVVGRNLAPGPLAEELLLPAVFDLPDADGLVLVDGGAVGEWAEQIGVVRERDGRLRGRVELVRRTDDLCALLVVVESDTPEPSVAKVVRIDAAADGVTSEVTNSADPTAALCTIDVEDVELAGCEVLFTGQEAVDRTRRLRAWLRIFAACEMVGIAERTLEDSTAYAVQRRQFGRPVGSFQAVKHILAEMAQKSMSLSGLCRATLVRTRTADTGELEMAALTAYAHASHVARSVVEGGLQVHGGIGFTDELDLQLYIKRAYALSVAFGDAVEAEQSIGARRIAAEAARC